MTGPASEAPSLRRAGCFHALPARSTHAWLSRAAAIVPRRRAGDFVGWGRAGGPTLALPAAPAPDADRASAGEV
jgi:hypothetical protein